MGRILRSSFVVIGLVLTAPISVAVAQYIPPQPPGYYPYPASPSPPYQGMHPYPDAEMPPYDAQSPHQNQPMISDQQTQRPQGDIRSAPLPPPAMSPQDPRTAVAALPPDYQPEQGPAKEPPPQFRRTVVDYPTIEPPGTIIIDTPNTYLYLTLGHGKAIRYGVGVGRDGFTWSGTERISQKKEWPDWFPPKEMIARQPYLPRFVAGGETIRWARAPCISAIRNTASMAQISHRLSAASCPLAAFV